MKNSLQLLVSLAFLLCAASHLAASGTPCGNTSPAGTTPPCPGSGGDDCPKANPAPPPPSCSGSNPFDVYTGNAIRWSLDLEAWGSVGDKKLEWKRYHNTRLGTVGQSWFGQGGNWRHSYQWFVSSAGTVGGLPAIKVSQPQGAEYLFLQQSAQPDVWLPAANVGKRVLQNGNNYVMLSRDGSRFYFEKKPDSTFLPLGWQDSQDNYTTFTHDTQKRLSRITEPAGRTLDINYQTISLPSRTQQKIAIINASTVAGTWRTTTLTTPVERRFALFQGTANSYSRVAEVEFYDENNVKLTGTPISSPASLARPAALAFDGNPATGFESQSASFGYVGLDFGSAKKIKKVRVLLDPSGNGGEVYAMDLAPADVTVISSIQTNDARSVSYQYEAFPDSNPDAPYDYLVLKKAIYGDGTEAVYSYLQLYPMTSPLLETALEPRAGEDSTRIRYAYNTNGEAPLGLILKEIDLDTGDVLVDLGATNATSPVVTFSNGRVQKFNMGTNANLTDYIDGRGNKTRYFYNSGGGFLNKSTDPLGRSTLYSAHDALGYPLTVNHPDGTVETWTRDELGQVLTHTISGPSLSTRTTTTTRDAQHRPTRVDYPDGSYETFAYNIFGQITEKRERNGGIQTMAYSPTGLLLSRIDALGNTTLFTYDAHDRLASVTDPRGLSTTYSYNERGLPLQVTHPDGSATTHAYDDFGNKIARTNELGKTWTWTYNGWRQTLTTSDPLNRTTTYEYGLPADCGCGSPGSRGAKPSKITSPLGKVTELYYDKEWNLSSRIEASGTADQAVTLYAYDALGNLISTTDPRGKVWVNTYNNRNWKATAKDPLNNTTSWSYDGVGNVLNVKDALNRVTTNSYDSMNRLLSTVNPKLETVNFTYDNGDNLLSMTDAKSNVYSFEYDLLNRKTKMIYPDAGSGAAFEAWSYNDTAAAGTVWSVYTARDGSTMSCTYDNRGRETLCDYSDPNTPDVTKTYDAVGRQLTASSSSASYSYTYDDANQLLSETSDLGSLPSALSVSYTYDADGNRASLTYPDGRLVEYDYTARNQVKNVRNAATPPVAAYVYDLNGNRVSKTLKNAVVTDYAYDNASRLTQIKQTGGAGVFSTVNYTLNNVGNRTVKAITGTGLGALNLTENYSYDPIDQVTGVASSANTQTFAYDAVGNRTSVTATAAAPGVGSYTTNALNQYTQAGAEVLLYDTKGNLATKGLSASYGYDSKNRLISATANGGMTSVSSSFEYDYRNRQVSRTIDGVTTYFVYDGWNLIAEYNSGGAAPLAEYVHGAGVDEILFKHDTIHGSVYYHQDGLGSTTHLTDVIGMVVESYKYDVFGAVSIIDQLGGALTASFYGNRFLFTGREWIQEVGLYDYRNRVYSPELGRFLQSDPIRFDAGDVNLYRYVGNNSVNFTDPLGLYLMVPGRCVVVKRRKLPNGCEECDWVCTCPRNSYMPASERSNRPRLFCTPPQQVWCHKSQNVWQEILLSIFEGGAFPVISLPGGGGIPVPIRPR